MRPNRGARRWTPRRLSRQTSWRVWSALGCLVLQAMVVPAASAIRLLAPEVFRLEAPDFVEPVAVAAGPLGKLYLCDVGRGTVVGLDAEAQIQFEFGSPSTQPDLQPLDVEVTGFQVYVLDAASNALLRFTDRGTFLDVLQNFTESRLETPRALAVDGVGRVLLANPARHRVTLQDEKQVAETAVGGFGTRPGELSSPRGVAFARDGAFYVSDTDNARVQVFSGVGNWVASIDSPESEPHGLAVDRDGILFVADARGAVHALAASGDTLATLEWPEARPLDVAVQGETLWVLTREPATLLRVRIVRGD